MKESEVELIVKEYISRTYTSDKGWVVPKVHVHEKEKGEHGIDISVYNQKRGERLIIEVKKWSETNAVNHNTFYSIFGQILSRINETPSENYFKKKKIIIAAPKKFIQLIHKKIYFVKNNKGKGMIGGGLYLVRWLICEFGQ